MQGRVVLPPVVSPPLVPRVTVAYGPGGALDSVPAPVSAEGSEPVAALAPSVERRGLSPRTVARLLVALMALNLLDAVMTLWAVRLGVATEANPVMAMALDLGEPVFLLAKIGVVGIGCAVLWAARHRRIAQLGACGCVAVYVLLALVHVVTGALIAEALRGMSGLA